MLHQDHMGNRGDLKSGDVQWMTGLMRAEASLSLITVAREGLAFSTEPFLKAFGIH